MSTSFTQSIIVGILAWYRIMILHNPVYWSVQGTRPSTNKYICMLTVFGTVTFKGNWLQCYHYTGDIIAICTAARGNKGAVL